MDMIVQRIFINCLVFFPLPNILHLLSVEVHSWGYRSVNIHNFWFNFTTVWAQAPPLSKFFTYKGLLDRQTYRNEPSRFDNIIMLYPVLFAHKGILVYQFIMILDPLCGIKLYCKWISVFYT